MPNLDVELFTAIEEVTLAIDTPSWYKCHAVPFRTTATWYHLLSAIVVELGSSVK